MTPVFIFSLPRSGSTLLQSLVSSHERISTVSEPWLLLPLITTTCSTFSYSKYYTSRSSRAIKNLIGKMSDGKEGYYKNTRSYIKSIYEDLSDNESEVFVDKTPRYSIICDEIIKTFPDSKKIFLWRRPTSIIASMIKSWGNGYWNIYRSKIDLFMGLEKLVDTFEKNKESSISVKYEDLVTETYDMKKIFDYIGMDFKGESFFKNQFEPVEGSYGDKEILNKSEIDQDSLEKWKDIIKNPVRKMWVINYLKWIGEDRLNTMGYKMNEEIRSIKENETSFRYALSDLLRIAYGKVRPLVEPSIISDKVKLLKDGNILYEHK